MRADLPVVLWDCGLFPLSARNNTVHHIIVLFPPCVDLGGNERLEKDLLRHPAAELCSKESTFFNLFVLTVQKEKASCPLGLKSHKA